ncbi:unnamed protein product [Diplocarpon coronariae]
MGITRVFLTLFAKTIGSIDIADARKQDRSRLQRRGEWNRILGHTTGVWINAENNILQDALAPESSVGTMLQVAGTGGDVGKSPNVNPASSARSWTNGAAMTDVWQNPEPEVIIFPSHQHVLSINWCRRSGGAAAD